jgi:hypothetical protein
VFGESAGEDGLKEKSSELERVVDSLFISRTFDSSKLVPLTLD